MSPSPDHLDPHRRDSDDTLHRRALDELASHALGEPLAPDLAAHVESCLRCREELEAYRATVALARVDAGAGIGIESGIESGVDDRPAPSPHVWDRILAEVSSTSPSARETSVRPIADATKRRESRSARRAVIALLAAAVVVGAGAVGWVFGTRHAGQDTGIASAQLAAQRGTAARAHGRATMRSSADGFEMHVTTAGLPAPRGYYEVWLFDPSANRMVAIGTLGTDAMGTFTVPAGIDTHAYHVVDVSDQRYNGDPAHQTSVLRGALAQ